MAASIFISTEICSDPSTIWKHLTDVKLMAEWMGDPEMDLVIDTSWVKGDPIIIRGFHHELFENRGVILYNEPNSVISYTHLSSLSKLGDEPQNYAVLTFTLAPLGNNTLLTLYIENFVTETIKKHLQFYWRGTMEVLKTKVEDSLFKI